MVFHWIFIKSDVFAWIYTDGSLEMAHSIAQPKSFKESYQHIYNNQ